MKYFFKKLVYTVVFIALFIYGFYTLSEQQVELEDLRKEKIEYLSLCDAQDMKHEQLLQIKSSMNTDEYIEEIARDKLGFVMPYEIIFVDASI